MEGQTFFFKILLPDRTDILGIEVTAIEDQEIRSCGLQHQYQSERSYLTEKD